MAESRRRPAHGGRHTSNVAAAFMTGTATARVSPPVTIVRHRVVQPTTSQEVRASTVFARAEAFL
jgi:hypothetical protein